MDMYIDCIRCGSSDKAESAARSMRGTAILAV